MSTCLQSRLLHMWCTGIWKNVNCIFYASYVSFIRMMVSKAMAFPRSRQFVVIRLFLQYRCQDKEGYSAPFPIIFLILLERTLCCGYSKESSHRDDSFEYSQHRVRGSNKELRTCKTPLSYRALFISLFYCI